MLGNVHPALRRCWHPIALSEEITEIPARFWLVGEPWVAVRLATGLAVLSDRCPHRLAPLSAGCVVDGELRCSYHGWRFCADGGATMVPSRGSASALAPGTRAERPFGVVEQSGTVFVAVEEPIAELPESEPVAVHREEEARVVRMGPYEGRYGAALLIDNQIDVSHFAFLHRGTFGSKEATQLPPYAVRRTRWGFGLDLSIPIAARNDPGVTAAVRPLDQYREMAYRYCAPFHLSLTLSYPVMGGSNTIVFWAAPLTPDRARLYVTMHLWQPGGFSDQELADRVAFEERVAAEDLEFQARFDELALPLDPTTECHVRSDRASLEYRRLLRALVIAAAPGEADAENTHGKKLFSGATVSATP
jgi:phenylpropionate dioxygenase-like ring-hydroxylating dioxygenase large terminal subunit